MYANRRPVTRWARWTKRTCIVVCFLFALSLAIYGQSSNRVTSRLAYVHNQAVWIKTLPAGEPLRVLPTTARDLVWCFSGSWLALRASDKTFVISADGRQQFRIMTDAFAWSPVKDELAFKAEDGVHVDRFDSDGPHPRVIMRQADVDSFSWSHDGTRLAVAVQVNGSAHLWLANDDGARPREIGIAFDLGEVTFAGWSGDDKWILMWPNPGHSASIAADGLGMIAVPLTGGSIRSLSDILKPILKDHDVLLYRDYVSFARSDPGVVVTIGGDRQSWTNKRIMYINPANGRFSVLTDASMATAALDWSPDGKRILYSIAPDTGPVGGGEPAKAALAQRRIWMMDADGKHQQPLTSDPAYRDERPLWSRTGRTILFVRMDRQDNIGLWTIDVRSKELQKVVDAIADPDDKGLWFSFYGHIVWSDYFAWSR
jgi:Tol biopolymer transport system component